MTIQELNTTTETLFSGCKRAWEDNSRIRYIWGNVLALDGQIKYYINDDRDIISEVTSYDKVIAEFDGKMWYVGGCLVGFTRNSDNKYVVPQALGVADCDMGYYIKGISESLKILADEKRQSEESKNATLNAILGLS